MRWTYLNPGIGLISEMICLSDSMLCEMSSVAAHSQPLNILFYFKSADLIGMMENFPLKCLFVFADFDSSHIMWRRRRLKANLSAFHYRLLLAYILNVVPTTTASRSMQGQSVDTLHSNTQLDRVYVTARSLIESLWFERTSRFL